MIELVDVSKHYGDIAALRDVSLTVGRGEFLTVVGPNGSGKTTLLKIMAALERPTSGEVYFDGVRLDESNATQLRRRCTMVLQRTVVLRGSVENNVAYGLRARGLPRQEVQRRVGEAMEVVGLGGFEDRDARGLSGGEQQRLSLARALALGCELLLLDEPTANLDPESLSVVKEAISWLNSETRTTVVMATHNLLQAEELSERFVLLDRGEVVESGSPASILTSPSREMARFARLENVFTGTSRIVEGVSYIGIGGGVEIKAAFSRPGRVTVHVRPEAIILSLAPVETSALNQLRSRISSIDDRGSVVRLKIDAGKIFTVQITRRSFVEMGLNVGSEVYLTFKASSVQLI